MFWELRFHTAIRFSNPISSLFCTRYLSRPGEREQGHHFPQRLLVLHMWVACRHLSIEQSAVPTDLIDPKSVSCPLLCHGNHPNKTKKNYPQNEFMADKMNETVE